ncbi:MAG: ATP/GTP-binding protein [Thermoproteota archaeon]
MTYESAIFVIGTAGSGKTMLTASLCDFLLRRGLNVAAINLDPGVEFLPYEPSIDAREYVDVGTLMREEGLGPNSALVLGCDMLVNAVNEIKAKMDEVGADIFIVDTPGQIELFALRASGSTLAKELFPTGGVVLFLIDGVVSQEPMTLISNIFLSSSVYARFLMSQINVLTKKDLLEREAIINFNKWLSNKDFLLSAVRERYGGHRYLIASGILESVASLKISPKPLLVSSVNFDGFLELYATISRILLHGEDGYGELYT